MLRSDRSAGFTLVEAAVALAILAAGLILLQRLQLGAVRTERAALAREAALMRAEGALSVALARGPAAAATLAGPGLAVVAEPFGEALFRVTVTADAGTGRAPVRLATLVPR
jgi:Tfp pilus assembly protein PilV